MSAPVLVRAPVAPAPLAPFLGLSTLWVQITGTWCNLECRHCINASGPRAPWLKPLAAETVGRAIREAEELGVKEIYFTLSLTTHHRQGHTHALTFARRPLRLDLHGSLASG